MPIQERNRNGKPSYVARGSATIAAPVGFPPGILCAQTPFQQMSVDSTKRPITVTASEICFAGEIKKGGPE
ncbi:hypothetical protein NKI51_04130 [Mesorhizobium australicum]|uniref:hypothetical protein n=1 Tax=Mesorhizobium TaxID=68287 RepID=UPI0012EB32D5|nr:MULTISPECIES: hypothetical protein [unclassified Mesorhizobium]